MKKLKLAFFGTPDFAASFLEKLLADKELPVEVSLVVTQPDRAVGRKQIISPSPTKQAALKYNVKVYEKQSKDELKQALASIDLALLLFYGKIIPKDVLNVPKFGFWNLHFSALPKYRGGLPHVYAIMMGEKQTAVTLFKMDETLDTGPVIAQGTVSIDPHMKRQELEERCTGAGYTLVQQALKELAGEFIITHEQDHTEATYTRLLKRDDGFIPLAILKKELAGQMLTLEETPQIIKDFVQRNNMKVETATNATIYNLFRALYPWPGLWTTIHVKGKEQRLKITDVNYVEAKLVIKKVQLEGKKEVDFATFTQAYGW